MSDAGEVSEQLVFDIREAKSLANTGYYDLQRVKVLFACDLDNDVPTIMRHRSLDEVSSEEIALNKIRGVRSACTMNEFSSRSGGTPTSGRDDDDDDDDDDDASENSSDASYSDEAEYEGSVRLSDVDIDQIAQGSEEYILEHVVHKARHVHAHRVNKIKARTGNAQRFLKEMGARSVIVQGGVIRIDPQDDESQHDITQICADYALRYAEYQLEREKRRLQNGRNRDGSLIGSSGNGKDGAADRERRSAEKSRVYDFGTRRHTTNSIIGTESPTLKPYIWKVREEAMNTREGDDSGSGRSAASRKSAPPMRQSDSLGFGEQRIDETVLETVREDSQQHSSSTSSFQNLSLKMGRAFLHADAGDYIAAQLRDELVEVMWLVDLQFSLTRDTGSPFCPGSSADIVVQDVIFDNQLPITNWESAYQHTVRQRMAKDQHNMQAGETKVRSFRKAAGTRANTAELPTIDSETLQVHAPRHTQPWWPSEVSTDLCAFIKTRLAARKYNRHNRAQISYKGRVVERTPIVTRVVPSPYPVPIQMCDLDHHKKAAFISVRIWYGLLKERRGIYDEVLRSICVFIAQHHTTTGLSRDSKHMKSSVRKYRRAVAAATTGSARR